MESDFVQRKKPLRLALLTVDNRFESRSKEERESGSVPRFGTAPAALLEGFAMLGAEQIEVHVIACTSRFLPSPKKLADNIWYHALCVPRWGFLRSLYLGCAVAVRRKIRELDIDIVHAQGTERWCAISGAFAKSPKVLTVHGNVRLINKVSPMKPRLYWKLQEMLEIFSMPRFDGLVAISRYTEENAGTLAKRSWLVPNAVESSFFDIEPEQAEPKEILVVANIQSRKNQVAFIDALAPLAERHSFHVRFFGYAMAGDDFADEFLGRVNRYPWCSFEGVADRPRLRQAFSEATLLALPTLEDNCPMSILESMAAGVPAVASDTGGIPDLIRNRETGILCSPTDADSLRKAVEILLTDDNLRKKIAEKARKEARANFHPETVAKKHLGIYRELVRTNE